SSDTGERQGQMAIEAPASELQAARGGNRDAATPYWMRTLALTERRRADTRHWSWEPSQQADRFIMTEKRLQAKAADRRRRFIASALVVAAVAGVIHGLFSLYWAIGGDWLVESLGHDLQSAF